MKTIKYPILLATSLLFLFFSCASDSGQGEPTQWFHIFQLVDKDGRDFLSTQPDYDLEKIQACIERQQGVIYCYQPGSRDESNLMVIKNREEKYICLFNGMTDYLSTIYLDFGNGDVDTLTFVSQPEAEYPNAFWTNINEFHIFYNGRHAYTYDLKNDNPPRLDLYYSGPDENDVWTSFHSFVITKLERDSL